MNISKNIKNLRKQKNLSQNIVAEFCGVKQSTVSKWEGGISCPSAFDVVKLAELFEVSTDKILGFGV